MDEFDIRLIAVLLFLVFGSTLVAMIRKMKFKIFKPKVPVYDITITSECENPVTFTGMAITLPETLVSGTKKACEQIQYLPEITSDHLDILEEKFLANQENKIFARIAIQTFRAWHSGVMLTILDPDNQFSQQEKKPFVPKINHPEFDQFVLYTFLGVQNGHLMPKTMRQLQAQYAHFFRAYDFGEDEYLLGWAQQVILTSQNLVLFTTGDTIKIQTCIPISKIQNITQIQTGIKRLE